ncbi:hypothetical protein ACRAWF_22970 [Streptomyces sp. L7]
MIPAVRVPYLEEGGQSDGGGETAHLRAGDPLEHRHGAAAEELGARAEDVPVAGGRDKVVVAQGRDEPVHDRLG